MENALQALRTGNRGPSLGRCLRFIGYLGLVHLAPPGGDKLCTMVAVGDKDTVKTGKIPARLRYQGGRNFARFRGHPEGRMAVSCSHVRDGCSQDSCPVFRILVHPLADPSFIFQCPVRVSAMAVLRI